jgi:hypothetical protein
VCVSGVCFFTKEKIEFSILEGGTTLMLIEKLFISKTHVVAQ